MARFALGTLIRGTHRNEDLLPCFLAEVTERFGHDACQDVTDACAALVTLTNIVDDTDEVETAFYASEWADETVNDLQDKLSEDLPPYVYFGTLEGDGSDFGYWFNSEDFEDARRDGTVHVVKDPYDADAHHDIELEGSEYSGRNNVPDDAEYVAYVTDHGNVTIYALDGTVLFEVV